MEWPPVLLRLLPEPWLGIVENSSSAQFLSTAGDSEVNEAGPSLPWAWASPHLDAEKKASQNCVDLSMCPRGLGQVCAVQALGTWCLLPSHGTPSNGSRGPQNVSICCNQKGGQDRKGEWLYISQSKYLHRFTDSKPGSNLTRLHSQLSANIHWALTMCHALCQVLEKKRSKNS